MNVRALVRRLASEDALRSALPPWVLARVIVVAALVAAYLIWDRFIGDIGPCLEPPCLYPDSQSLISTFLRREQGLLAWDGDWYVGIATGGYASMPVEALRYFPLYPLAGRFLASLFGGSEVAGLLFLSNAAALLMPVLLYKLASVEGKPLSVSRRSVWIITLAPPAFVLVMAYTEALAISLAIAVFLSMRRGRWWSAAVAGLLSGLLRPTGLLLVPAIAFEAYREQRRDPSSPLLPRLIAVVSPLAGMSIYLLWSHLANGDAWLPLTVQNQANGRGPFAFPLATLYGAAADAVTDARLDLALHLVWLGIFAALIVVAFRRWPASYGIYAAVSVMQAISTTNLNSLERYGFAAFPLALAAGSVEMGEKRERLALVVLAILMFAYATAAFDSGYVP